MSDNPFASPADPSDILPDNPQTNSGQKAAPGALTAICVLCLIFGLFGSSGSCFSGIASVFQEQFSNSMLGLLPDQPEFQAQKELTEDLLTITISAQKPMMIPQLILYALKLIVGVMMFVGAIGCLRKKEGFRNLLRTSLLGACICSALAILLGIYAVMVIPPALAAELSNFADNANFGQLENSVNQSVRYSYIGTGIGTPIGLALLGFYWWSRKYLNRPNIVQLFS